MKKVLFATGNESKKKRFQKGLLENGIEILTLNDIDKKIEVEETGKDGVENALIKARSYAEVVDMPVFAMDDNFEKCFQILVKIYWINKKYYNQVLV